MLLQEKAAQVQPLLRETGLDCWLILVRETGLHPDPGFDLVVGADVVRNSAFLFSAGGQRIALTACFDVTGVRNTEKSGRVAPGITPRRSRRSVRARLRHTAPQGTEFATGRHTE